MKNRIAIVGGAAIAVLGVVLAWRALGPLVPTASRPPAATSEQLEAAQPQAPQPSLLPASLDDPVTAENLEQRVDAIVKTLGNAQELERLSAARREALLSEAERQLQAYLGGSADKFVENLRRHDANHPLTDPEVSEEDRERFKTGWLATSAGIALKATSVDDVRVRPRFIDGSPVEVDEPSQPAIASTADQRYGLGGRFDDKDAKLRRLTVYEVLVPIAYEYDHKEVGGRGPAWWGLWLASHPDEPGKWLPWRSVLYDPMKIGARVPPAI